jgi:hypothetical protein
MYAKGCETVQVPFHKGVFAYPKKHLHWLPAFAECVKKLFAAKKPDPVVLRSPEL